MNNWYYGSKWGLTDLYPDVEKEVRNLVDSDRPFDRVGIDSQKEIEGWAISCDGDKYTISVWAAMDDVPDVIYDAPHGEDLTEEETKAIEDMLFADTEFSTEEFTSMNLPISSTLEDIYKVVSAAGESLRESLHEHFGVVCDLVSYVLNERRPSND